MPADRDPLELLRDAWKRVDAPEVPGGGRLADEDEATRATVRWAREAWAAVPVPTPAGVPRRGRVLRLTTTAAAAAAALLLVATGLMSVASGPGAGPDGAGSSVGASGAPSIALAALDDGPSAEADRAGDAAAPVPTPPPDPLVVLLGSEACVCSPADPSRGLRPPLPVLSVVQRSSLLDSAIAANRNGSWSDAAEKAQLVLDREEASTEDRLGALCQLALSFQALGQRDESTAYLSRLEEEISDLRRQ